MKKFDEYSYGAELEYGDFNRKLASSKIAKWGVVDSNDFSVMNSDGSVGDPYNGNYGGEIVTYVNNSPEELAESCSNIVKNLDKIDINHSCWLHIHVGVGKINDLDILTDIAQFVYLWSNYIKNNKIINSPKLDTNGNEYYLRNETRLSTMNEGEIIGCLSAQDLEEFWSHFDRKRHLINMRSIKTIGTIEYRFLAATKDKNDFLLAAKMCEEITNNILNKNDNFDIINVYSKKHKVIDMKLESLYRDNIKNIQKKPKVDNFTGILWQ